MRKTFNVAAVADDGEVFTEDYSILMGLPFDNGWDHWLIVQGDHVVGAFPDYALAHHTCSALNATVLFKAA